MGKKNVKSTINPKETIKLWTSAGGRCEYPGCNEFLLKDNLTGRECNFGEMAHNVGKKKTIDSPRGQHTLSLEKRSKADNHLLLCLKHHKLIDTKEFLKFYTVEELKSYKSEHENRIKYLTSLSSSRKSVVLRMLSKIHNDCVSITNDEISEALLTCANRYPEYLLKEHNNLEINLCELPNVKNNHFWKIALSKIDEVYNRQISPQIGNQIEHLSIFAIAPIPLLIYLGAKFGNKIGMDVYQKQFFNKENWIWCKGKKGVEFEFKKIKNNKTNSKVAVLLSISGKISLESIPTEIKENYNLYEFQPKNISPGRNLIQNQITVSKFRQTYQQFLRKLESNHKKMKEVLLFPATPVSISFYCGSDLMKALLPKLTVYELDRMKFKKAISFNLIN